MYALHKNQGEVDWKLLEIGAKTINERKMLMQALQAVK